MYILGVSCYYHDSAVALIKDGILIAAAEEERFSRKKHDYGFPTNAIDFCLAQGGINGKDLDYVVFYEKPLVKFERILMTTLSLYPRSWKVFRESMITWLNDKLWIKGKLLVSLDIPSERILFVDHHLSHAASAFFCSPFEQAAIMTVDGVGEWSTATIGQATADWTQSTVAKNRDLPSCKGESSGMSSLGPNFESALSNRIDLFNEVRFPHSLGLLYSAFTAYLGFKVNNGEYKVMGMAPYGEPRYLEEVYKLIQVDNDGGFRLNMDYFCFHHSTSKTFNGRFTDLFGPSRIPESDFYTETTYPNHDCPNWDNAIAKENQRYADIAASIQRVTEDILIKMANYVYRRTGLKKLCIAGGVGLNSVANGRILKETPFDELYIQPAAGDAGGALGAALYVYHVLLGKPRQFVLEHCYWGQSYSEDKIQMFLNKKNISYEHIEDQDKLANMVVDGLVHGKVIGWFQGKFEWGPRALGNRSILADPRRAEMKEIVNAKIKFREPFRPFAPVILEECTAEYFDFPDASRHYPARFMLYVTKIRDDKSNQIPAVNHQGTGRLQTIRREINPRYYQLVEKFGQATGVPVLLNTSFNLRGEPIVASPANAFNTFSNSGIDILVLGNNIVSKT
ncbi:MAG: carbamoyltransferase N-terminal domain-containing protein [Planctomycetota bacterium]